MNRREFLLIAATASSALASGRLPLLAQTQEQAGKMKQGDSKIPERNIFTEPPAIEPITGFLPSFSLTKNEALNPDDYELSYKSVIWIGVDPKTGKSQNREDGNFTLRRKRDGNVINYTIEQKRRHGRRINRLNAQFLCDSPSEALMEWTIKSDFLEAETGNIIPDLAIAEKGIVRENSIYLDSGNTNTKFPAKGLVFSQWNIICLLNRGIKNTLSFDMMQELSIFKPGQVLKYTGEIQIPTAGGQAKLYSYAQTGHGILPTHYLVDSVGHVQLITQSMLNWALQKVT